MISRLCVWHGCPGASPKPLHACVSTARGKRLKRLVVLADEVRTAVECSSRAVWVGCMMSEKLEGRKRLLTKPAAHRSLQQLPPRKLLEGCGPAGGRLDESSDGVFGEAGDGEGV